MNPVSMLAPALHTRRQSGADAVNDGDIGSQVAQAVPGLAGLETGAFERLGGIRGERRRRLSRKQGERTAKDAKT
jgi:hypothetical protein